MWNLRKETILSYAKIFNVLVTDVMVIPFCQALINAWDTACSSPERTAVVVPADSSCLVHPIYLGGPCCSKVTLVVWTKVLYLFIYFFPFFIFFTNSHLGRLLEPSLLQQTPKPGMAWIRVNGCTSTMWTTSLLKGEGQSTGRDRNGGLVLARSIPQMYENLQLWFCFSLMYCFFLPDFVLRGCDLFCSHVDMLRG